MISHEYGWTDRQILDLPYARYRQVRDVTHKQAQARRDEQWSMTRALATFIAGATGDESFFESARTIGLPADQKKPKVVAPAEPAVGSFERLIALAR